MKKILYLILSFSLPLAVQAQYSVASTTTAGKKTIIKTRPAQGYVIKTDGTKLEGTIKLKVVDSDTTEIQLKNFDGVKTTFERSDLKTFGLKEKESSGDGGAMKSKPKTGKFSKGYVVLNDGTKIDGQIATSSGFFAGDFKKKIWGFFLKTEGNTEPKYYGTEDDVDHVAQTEKGTETKYTPTDAYFVDFAEWMKDLENPKSKEKAAKLQTGHVMFTDGKKLEGRIAKQKENKFIYVSSDNKVEILFANNTDISYIKTRIDGEDRKYIPLMSGIKAFSGPKPEWVEIFKPSELYSYYQNPAPTHKKEGMTNLANTGINAATDKVASEVNKKVTEEQFKSDIKDGKDVVSSANNAVATGNEMQENISNIVTVDEEGGLYFEEWIIMDNATGQKIAIYKKNDEEVMSMLLNKCGNASSLDKSEIKKLTNVDNIDNLVTYLNANKCN